MKINDYNTNQLSKRNNLAELDANMKMSFRTF